MLHLQLARPGIAIALRGLIWSRRQFLRPSLKDLEAPRTIRFAAVSNLGIDQVSVQIVKGRQGYLRFITGISKLERCDRILF